MNHLSRAIKIANRSRQKKHRTGCVITDCNEPISIGWSHTGQWRMNELYSVHAEIHAILRGKHEDLGGCEIFIATLAKSGQQVSAKPCLTCATTLVSYGIEWATYTLGSGGSESIFLPGEIESATLKQYKKRS